MPQLEDGFGTERKQSESDPDALVARASSCYVQADAFDDEEDDAAAWFIWATRGAPLHAKRTTQSKRS